MNLYDITKEIAVRMDALQERLDNGELPEPNDDEVREILGLIGNDLSEKIGQYRFVMLNLDAKLTACKNEIDRLQKRKQSIDDNLKRLKKAVLLAMQTSKQTKFEFDTGKIWRQKSAPSLKLSVPPASLPVAYQRIEITACTDDIKKALKRGDVIAGAELVQGEHIRIS